MTAPLDTDLRIRERELRQRAAHVDPTIGSCIRALARHARIIVVAGRHLGIAPPKQASR